MTSNAPWNPCTAVVSDDHPKLTIKSGMANGTTKRTAHTLRPGRSGRSTHHAVKVPTSPHNAVTPPVRLTVLRSKVAVNGRHTNRHTVSNPTWCAWMSKKTTGVNMITATTALAPSNAHGGRSRRRAATSTTGSWICDPMVCVMGASLESEYQLHAHAARDLQRRHAVSSVGEPLF